jgi:hypothetical protein
VVQSTGREGMGEGKEVSRVILKHISIYIHVLLDNYKNNVSLQSRNSGKVICACTLMFHYIQIM